MGEKMKPLFLVVVPLTLFLACGARKDSQTFRSQGQTLRVTGVLQRDNDLTIKINDTPVIEARIAVSPSSTTHLVTGSYQAQAVTVLCTLSSFSITTTFCTVSLDGRDVVTLKFE